MAKFEDFLKTKEDIEKEATQQAEVSHKESIKEALRTGELKPTSRLMQEHLIIYPDLAEFIEKMEDKTKNYMRYQDEKAINCPDFRVLAQLLWRRAYALIKDRNRNVRVLDPCMGGGKLLSGMQPDWQGCGYEKDYSMYKNAKALLQNTLDYDVKMFNEPFEYHFSTPVEPEYDLVVSIPYYDTNINCILEKDPVCQQFENYAYYCMSRSIDVLSNDGYGVFAIPDTVVGNPHYQTDRVLVLEKARVLRSEKFNNFAILVLQKNII